MITENTNNMIQTISALLENFTDFAKLGEKVQLKDYTFEVMDHFKYPVGVQYLSVPRSQVHSIKEAYVVLIRKELHLANEWEDKEEVPAYAWKDFWLPEWFMVRNKELLGKEIKNYDIKEMPTDKFLKETQYWLREVIGLPEEEIKAFVKKHEQAQIIEVCKVYAGYNCFGMTKDRYFTAEFGCGYD